MRDVRSGTAYTAGYAVGRPAPVTRYTTAQQNQHFETPHYVPSGGVRALQAFLKNKGYAIAVDGVRGDQTEAAIRAYHDGISPTAWNKRSVHASRGSASSKVASARSGGRAPVPVRRVATGRPPVNRTAPLTNPIAAANAASAAADPKSLTPEQMAQAAANAQFDPQIADMNAQIAAARAAGAQNVANLGTWYGQIADTASAAATQQQQNDLALQGQQQQGQQNLLQLFGGAGANGAAGEAGAFTDINNAALQQLSAANENYANQMPTVVGMQGTEAKAASQQDTNSMLAQLASQLAGLTGAKSSAYTAALGDAQQTQYNAQQDAIKNAQAQQALDLANALAPSQVRKANADASLASFNAANAPIAARMKAKQFGMSMQRYQAELRQTKARTAQIIAGAKKASADGKIDWNDPNTRASLAKQLRPIIQSKAGTWRMHPGAAQQNLNLALAQLGLSGNPNAIAIRNQLLQETVNNSHANKQWGQFNYSGGKIVKTGSRYKPKNKKK